MENFTENFEIAKLLMPNEKIVKAKCVYDPEDGSLMPQLAKNSYNHDKSFYYPCYLIDKDEICGLESFYDAYYSLDHKRDWYYKEKFLQDSLEYDGYCAAAFSPVRNYVSDIDNVIKEHFDIQYFWNFYNTEFKTSKNNGLSLIDTSNNNKAKAFIKLLKS